MLGKITKQIFLEDISKHVEDKKLIGHDWHYFALGKFCVASLVSFYDGVNASVDKSCVIYLDVCKALGKASLNISAAAVRVIWLDKWTLMNKKLAACL